MNFKPVYIVDGARTPFLKARNAGYFYVDWTATEVSA